MSTHQTFDPIVNALMGIAGRILASSRRHRDERIMRRFSNRELADVGQAK
ncbi:hypothetical protein ACWTU6_30880 [Mesorhizobium sp. BHbsci]